MNAKFSILSLCFAASLYGNYIDENGTTRIGSPTPEQQRRMATKARQERMEPIFFPAGTSRQQVEAALKLEPGAEIVGSGADFITFVTHFTKRQVEYENPEQKTPTDLEGRRTGPNTWEARQVKAQPVQVIMGGRDGIKEVYADGTVVTKGRGQEVLKETQWDVKVQVFFKGDAVESGKILSKTKVN